MPAIAGIIFIIGFIIVSMSLPKLPAPAALSSFKFSHPAPTRSAYDDLKKINAASAVVVETKSSLNLLNYKSDELRSIASLTKLMTVLVFLDHNPGWNKEVIIEKNDLRSGAKANIFAGDKLSVKDLFSLSLVASDNSAIATLVRISGLSEEDFVKAMNTKAKDLSLGGLSFTDPTGLDPENKGTARAVAKLFSEALSKKEIAQSLATPDLEFKVSPNLKRRAFSTNQLLGRELPKGTLLVGGKTGHLDEAGYCFAGAFKFKNKEIITVVLGANLDNERFSETLKILDWTIQAYIWEN